MFSLLSIGSPFERIWTITGMLYSVILRSPALFFWNSITWTWAITFPSTPFTKRSWVISFNFNLNTLVTISGQSLAYWFGKSSFTISGQFGLQVTVTNKSGFSYFLTIVIKS